MDNKVELKVNVINQLKLFRQSTFKDILCFLDEDIQNAQRAKATEVYVTTNTYERTLTIENNGAILDNPQSLFSIAESGWDNDTMKNENPFGMGFFSNISVSDSIEILSGHKYIKFNVNEMINSGNCELDVQEVEDCFDGFKLILNNFDYNTIYSYEIRDRLERLGKYIHELDIYYNGSLQEKKDLTESDNEDCFSIKIEDEDVQGWISINNNYGFTSEISIYYKGRFVSKLDGYPYLKGDLHINDRVLNLTSPDRKDIIKDNKLDEFKILINMYVKELAEDSFNSGYDTEIEDHCSAINYYIDKKSLIKKTRFATFNNKDIKYLEGIAIARSKDKSVKTFKDYSCWLDKEGANQGESHIEEVVVQEEMKSRIKEAQGVVFSPSSTSHHDSSIRKPEIAEKETVEKTGEIIFNNTQPVFWIGFDEIEKYEYKFNIIKHYDLKLLVARNKVEQEILKTVKVQYEVYHISELSEDITFESTISNMELSLKESRALMIFDMISRMFESSHNLFSIGDVMTTKSVSITNTDIKETIIDEDIVIIKDSKSDKVYVDRSIIKLYSIPESLDETLTLKDIQFILKNIDDISKSINMLKMNGTDKVKNTIIEVLANMN